jgi:hypothetical protein
MGFIFVAEPLNNLKQIAIIQPNKINRKIDQKIDFKKVDPG